MWVYRSAQDCHEPVVLFDYQPGRGQDYPRAFLAGYKGLLMTDGYAAWRTLEGPMHFGCLAHVRYWVCSRAPGYAPAKPFASR